MLTRLLLGGFLIAHGLVHATYASPPPPSGPVAWPFGLSRSWVLTPLGLGSGPIQIIGTVLWVVTAAAYVGAGLGYMGIPVLSDGWRALALAGTGASGLLLGLFWHPMLVLGLVIDAVIALTLMWPRAASLVAAGS